MQAQLINTNVAPQTRWADAWLAVREQSLHWTRRFAAEYELDATTLEKMARLHLPRFTVDELAHSQLIPSEVERLALRAARLIGDHRPMAAHPRLQTLRRNDVEVRPLDEMLAQRIHESFHYLGSPRKGRHFGLFHAEILDFPAAMVTISPMDVAHLTAQAAGKPARILSRMYAFGWAPFNAISYLLGSVARSQPGALFTYVNPNLGFNGSSYRSANWKQDGTKGITYRYHDGDYITAREAFVLPPDQVTYAHFDLEPLQIWRYDR